MLSHRTAYWVKYVSYPHLLLGLLGGDALRRFLIIQCKLDQFGSITISNCVFRSDLESAFAQATRAALEMIQRHDPRRFRVIEREVRLIVNQSLSSGARYDPTIRECKVDFARYWVDADGHIHTDPQAEDYEWYLARYASMLVHEATHGKLDSLRFAYTKVTRLRIERLCVSEQRRFLAHLPRDRFDFETLIPAFDAQRWETLWHMGYWERFRLVVQRQRENLRPR